MYLFKIRFFFGVKSISFEIIGHYDLPYQDFDTVSDIQCRLFVLVSSL